MRMKARSKGGKRIVKERRDRRVAKLAEVRRLYEDRGLFPGEALDRMRALIERGYL
jgi:hypothetical protein